MPLTFNVILRECSLDPKAVRLLRHKDKSATRGMTPYELWRDDHQAFEVYQSTQTISKRKMLSAPYWAAFVAGFSDNTLFVGIYSVTYEGVLEYDQPKPHMPGEFDKAGSCDRFSLNFEATMSEFIGRLIIDWGNAKLAWVQYANRHDKPVLEIRRTIADPPYPGHLNFIKPLSTIRKLPPSWIEVLKAARGIYVLTCPKTKEQYVGSADGPLGFWGRWMDYVKTGHGGNIGLKSKVPSDYQVAILEVAGTSATHEEVLEMEGRWQKKLQSREMGLNRNLAKKN